MDKEKKPIYKKVWFWVVAVLVLVGIGASGSNEAKKVGENGNSSNESSQVAKTEEKTEFMVGDVIAFDNKEITVEKVESGWLPENGLATPKEGNDFLRIHIKLENKSNSDMSYNIITDFNIEDADGAIDSCDLWATSADDSGMGSGEIAAGGKKSGTIICQAKSGTKGKLRYSPSFWSSKKVIVNL